MSNPETKLLNISETRMIEFTGRDPQGRLIVLQVRDEPAQQITEFLQYTINRSGSTRNKMIIDGVIDNED